MQDNIPKKPNCLSDLVPRGSTDLAKAFDNSNVLVREVSYELDGEFVKGTALNVSQYGTKPATYAEIVKECEKLMSAFPITKGTQKDTFYSILYETIQNEKMPLGRLQAAIKKIIAENKYPTFRIADVVGFDKKLNLAKSISALRYISRPQELTYSDIVVLYGKISGKTCRLYGIKAELENTPYASRIVGVWNAEQRGWNWVGQINDPTIADRQLVFKQSLFQFCNKPPRYNGKYDVDLVCKFYEKYSQVVPPNDTLLFETKFNWDTEMYLENFAKQQISKRNSKMANEPQNL